MRFGVQTVGSEGDVRPLVALAVGLRAAGHDVSVSICSDSRVDFQPICAAHDLRPVESPGSLDFARMAGTLSGKTSAAWSREFHRLIFLDDRREEQMYDVARSLCADNDVVISHYLSYPTKAAAVGSRTPHISVQLTHEHTPTQYRPCRGSIPNLGQRMNWMTWQEMFQMTEIGLQQPYRRFWESKGLPPFKHVWSLYFSDDLNLLGVSDLFCPQQPDWDGLHVVTGFLNLPKTTPSSPFSGAVAEFLAAGEPPVFMTFGSVQEIYPGSNVDQNLDLLVDAALRCGCRAVIQNCGSTSASYPTDALHPNTNRILFTDWIPYDQIFASCSLAVHHAGSGTCQLTLSNDCPSVLVPFTDHHWTFANELYRLGVAPQPVMRDGITADRLAGQINEVLSNPVYKTQAANRGVELRREDGVCRAVEAITKRFGGN